MTRASADRAARGADEDPLWTLPDGQRAVGASASFRANAGAASDFPGFIRSVLLSMGCDPGCVAHLEAEAPVELVFLSGPPIVLDQCGTLIRLTARFSNLSEAIVLRCAPDILFETMRSRAWVEGGTLCFGKDGDAYQLMARVCAQGRLDGAVLAGALDDFYLALQCIDQALQR